MKVGNRCIINEQSGRRPEPERENELKAPEFPLLWHHFRFNIFPVSKAWFILELFLAVMHQHRRCPSREFGA